MSGESKRVGGAASGWPTGLVPVRGLMSVPHLLVDERGGIVILDTGLPVDGARIRKKVAQLGAGPRDVQAILLTHGHLDHAGSLAEVKAWSGAPVYAHPLEQVHLDGAFAYRGLARVCGAMEAVGRFVMRYRPTRIDVPLADGDVLPFWGGLRVVHLPGHTLGHCGFYSAKHDLLFTGDLWARVLMQTQVSPAIFTSAPSLVWSSMEKARAIGARWIVPGHYDLPSAVRLRGRFQELFAERAQREPGAVV